MPHFSAAHKKKGDRLEHDPRGRNHTIEEKHLQLIREIWKGGWVHTHI